MIRIHLAGVEVHSTQGTQALSSLQHVRFRLEGDGDSTEEVCRKIDGYVPAPRCAPHFSLSDAIPAQR